MCPTTCEGTSEGQVLSVRSATGSLAYYFYFLYEYRSRTPGMSPGVESGSDEVGQAKPDPVKATDVSPWKFTFDNIKYNRYIYNTG